MKKFAQRSSQPLKNFSQTLDLPISAIYGGLVLIIVLAGVFIATASIRQEQSLSSEASQAEYGTVGCNQPCKNNRYCEADHFCYQGRCRLASNPQSPTCDPNEVFITPAPQPPTSIPTPTIQQKGDVIIKSPTATESTAGTIASSPTPTSTPSIVIPTTIPETESEPGAILGLLQQLPQIFENAELSLPMLVGIGLAGLILLLTLVAMINNRRKPKFKPTDFTNLREKSFSDNKKPKQENTAESLKSDQTPSPTQNKLEDLKPPPSSMVSRLKEKGVKKPK